MSSKKDHIKRPMNCFMVWSREKRCEILHENPGINNAKLSKLLGIAWRGLTREEKQPYVEKATQLTELHKQQHPDYKYQPNRRKTRYNARTNQHVAYSKQGGETGNRPTYCAETGSKVHFAETGSTMADRMQYFRRSPGNTVEFSYRGCIPHTTPYDTDNDLARKWSARAPQRRVRIEDKTHSPFRIPAERSLFPPPTILPYPPSPMPFCHPLPFPPTEFLYKHPPPLIPMTSPYPCFECFRLGRIHRPEVGSFAGIRDNTLLGPTAQLLPDRRVSPCKCGRCKELYLHQACR